ncbi:MAG: CvpA family protein [Alphaproteobacteria bacterium]
MTILDLVVLGLLLSTSLLGLSRGLVRTILNLVAWVVATGFTLAIRDPVNVFLSPYFDSRITTDVVSLALPFVILLVILQFLFSFLVRGVHRLMSPKIDHVLGLLFGFAFGAIMLAILWIVTEDFAPELLESEVAQRSRTFPYIARSALPVRVSLERFLPGALALPGGEVVESAEDASYAAEALGVVARARAAKQSGGLSGEELRVLVEDLSALNDRLASSSDEEIAKLLLLELRGIVSSAREGGGEPGSSSEEARRLLGELREDVKSLRAP